MTDRKSGKRPATGEFRLSILRALADQLAKGLAALGPDPLDLEHLDDVAAVPGVYQLYRDNELVYIGKGETSVANRLRQHHNKIRGRSRISLDQMSFTALYVPLDLHSVAPEKHLIEDCKARKLAEWNGTGFGQNNPGKERDTTVLGPNHFDTKHPINLEWICDEIEPGIYTAADLLKRVRAAVPFGFRYEKADFHMDAEVVVNSENPTVDKLFELLGDAINEVGPDWWLTALSGYVIMYGKPGSYPSMLKRYPSRTTPGQP